MTDAAEPGACPSRSRRADALLTAAALSPVVAGWAWKTFVLPRPFWANFYDPEVHYFYAATDLARGATPRFFHHPGTPLHVLGAAVVPFTGTAPTDIDGFRTAVYCAGILATLAGAYLLLRTLLRHASLPARLAALWVSFACPYALFANTMWSPESLFFPAGAVAAVLAARAFEDGAGPRRTFAAGTAIGLCCAMKVLFAGWAAALVLVAASTCGGSLTRRAAAAAAAAGGAAAGFALGTLPGIASWPEMFAYVTSGATSAHRQEALSGFANRAAATAENLASVMRSATPWHAALAALALLAAVLAVRSRRSASADEAAARRALLLAGTAFGATYLLVLSNLSIPRYLLASGPAVVLAVAVLPRLAPEALRARVAAALCGASALLLAHQLRVDIADHRVWVGLCTAQREEVNRAALAAAGGREDAVVVYGTRTFEPVVALGWFARSEDERRAVLAAFPGKGWYEPYAGRFHLPGGASAWDVAVVVEPHVAFLQRPHRVVARVAQFAVVVPGE